ncbi:CLUMA_CG000753, isoform A [Clunio marinus]|uniref:CLUMA_CG000753, isoform A n=1 Tax=Clunio marinus TaxID=568069 RepID=A0A1J1HHP2_9DIPT|nr:CLUMA_CG000753, isoform A [Clunio marinus]
MFGAKIQKWMEIVRPRKKSNKNKNGNGNLVSQNTSNDYKGAVYQNETSISSPARRSEVSPIQNHKGRRGWQSPNQEIPISSRVDYPLIKPNGNHSFKESSSLSTNTIPYNSNSNRPTTYLTTAPTTFYQMKELDQSMMQQNPQIIVTSKSSNGINSINNINNNNNIHYNNTLHPPPLCYSTATSSSNELLDDKPKYLISSSSSSVNSAVIKNQNESNNNVFVKQQQQQQSSESKYGKIQPINKYMSKYRFFSKNTSSIDRYNGNSSDDFCASNATLHDAQTTKTTALNDGGGKGKNLNSIICDSTNGAKSNSIKFNNEINNRVARNTLGGHSSSTLQQPSSNATTSKLYKSGSGNVFSGVANNNLAPPVTQHQTLQHGPNKLGYSVINHVSSPESAYSTGYSTDGNSPGGASYSPEYYINIRTGIHYFPKGNAAIEAGSNRFKSGLNRIEEKNDEQQFSHKRTESFDFCKSAITSTPQGQVIDSLRVKTTTATGIKSNCNAMPNPGMSPVLRKNIVMASQFRTPSPRQRCRIRTNPWFSSVDPEPFNITTDFKAPIKQRRDRDSGDSATSSSGIKSNSDESNEKLKGRKNSGHLSDSDSSSSTEKPNKTLVSLTEFRKKYKKENSQHVSNSTNQHGDSDDDATLNEIGKFDESYVYEKENDFLSDSDRTDCVSDLGQEAGDECDTDDLLDVEYIDKSNRTDTEKVPPTTEKKKQLKAKVKKVQDNQPKKRKKILRKRSRNSECRSPVTSNRGCRSVGGTPVSLRRNEKGNERRQLEASLSNRSNSLTFSEVHLIHSRMLAISESEKALIKADLEADVKYRQLIHEAESILISMKSNVTPKEVPTTVISSPRRVCNVPTNKRVEMLRNCEVDLKRELSKTSNNNNVHTTKFNDAPPANAHSIINKRLEMLRYETSMSAPSSPKTNRVAPIKTHVTNFIYQNEIELMQRREASSNKITPKSPAPLRRRFLTPKQDADSDSESDNKSSHSRASGKENSSKHISRIKVDVEPAKNNPPMISFRSVVCNNAEAEDLFFPQSEPLKRKIYSCSSTLDKIQRSLDFDSEVPKKALLQKIQMLRKERQAGKWKEEPTAAEHTNANTNNSTESPKPLVDDNIKRKLIMKTIEDIKRSLEDQSLELNELHDSDN